MEHESFQGLSGSLSKPAAATEMAFSVYTAMALACETCAAVICCTSVVQWLASLMGKLLAEVGIPALGVQPPQLFILPSGGPWMGRQVKSVTVATRTSHRP